MSKRVGSAVAVTLAAQLAVNLKGLVVLPIMIHFASPAIYGIYVMIVLSVSQVYDLLTGGVTYRFLRNLVSTHDSAERRRLFEPQYTFELIVFVFIAAGLLFGGPEIKSLFLASDVVVAPWLLVGFLGTQILAGWVIGYYRGTLRFTPSSVFLVAETVAFVAAIAVIAFVKRELTLDVILATQVSVTVATSLPFILAMLREMGLPRLRLHPRILIAELRAGLSITLDMLVAMIMGSGDRYLISFFLSTVDVARYQPSYQLASVILFFPRLIGTVLSPMLARMIDQGNRVGAERITKTSLRAYLMIGMPFIVGTLMVGPSIIALLTNPEMAEAGRWVAPLAAAATIFSGFLVFLNAAAIGFKRPRLILYADVKAGALSLAFNLALLPLLQNIMIPAVATLLARAVATISLMYTLRGYWRLHIDWSAIIRFCVAAAVMVTPLYYLGYRPGVVVSVSILGLTGAITASVVVYFAALSALGGFGPRQWSEITALLRSRTAEPNPGAEIGQELPISVGP